MASSIEQSYDADRERHSPLRHVGEVATYPLLVLRYRSLVRNFFRRELHGRFRGSVLGMLWVLVHPMFLFGTYYLVFGVLFNMRAIGGGNEMHYPLYLFIGILAWTAFIETTLRATGVVVENGNLIQKVAFPAQLLPLHLVAVNTIVYGVGVAVYLVVAWATGWPLPGTSILALPLVVLVQSVFALGVSLLLAASYVFLRDLQQIYPIVATLWFFATPVFWYPEMVHGEGRAFIERWAWLNPMHHLLEAHRTALGVTSETPFPTTGFTDALAHTGVAAIYAAMAFAAGLAVFRSLQHRFADEV